MAKRSTPKNMKSVSDEEIIAALDAHYGIVASAAIVIGCTRETLSRRISGSETLKVACDEAREKIRDLAENTLVTAMADGDVTAAIFVAKTLGKKRGYVEKQEISVPGGISMRWADSKESDSDG